MKRKIFRVLFALVLVLTLGLVTAVPAAAQAPTVTLETVGVGKAEWSATESSSGNYSVLLDAVDEQFNAGKVIIELDTPIAVENLVTFSYGFFGTSGAPPHVNFFIDVDGDGLWDATDDDILILHSWMWADVYEAKAWGGVYFPQGIEGDSTKTVTQATSERDWYPTGNIRGMPDWRAAQETFQWLEINLVAGTVLSSRAAGTLCGTGPQNGGDDILLPWSYWQAGVATGPIADPDEAFTGRDVHLTYTGPYAFNPKGIEATDEILWIDIEVEGWGWDPESAGYVDDVTINTTTYDLELPAERPLTVDDDRVENPDAYFQTIQGAIDCAIAGETVQVYAGEYNEQVYINKANLTVESVAGVATTFIDGTDVTDAELITGHSGLVWLQKDGTTLEGFTVRNYPATWGNGGVVYLQGWNGTTVDDITGCTITDNTVTVSTEGDNGIIVEGAADSNTISDNTITVSGSGGAGIIMAGKAGNDTTGNQITGNTITSIAGKYGISLNTDLADNQRNFPGTVISGNTISGDGNGIGLYFATGSSASHIVIQENTISGLSTFDGEGIELFHGGYVDILRNTLRSNNVGVQVKEAGSTNVVVNYNEFDENSVGVDVANLPGTLDAKYNWWDAATGPADDGEKNPYYTQAASEIDAEVCTGDVDFIPWMIHTDLASGWNVYSTPIACGDTTDTITEALDLWTDDTALAAYYFDGSSQTFEIATSLTTLQAVYLNMSAAATIDVISSTSYIAPPSQTAYAGWNLIGLAELYPMNVEDALASAYYVAGANNIGYSQVVSPGLGQTAWSAMRGAAIDTLSDKGMAPCEGYWLSMVNQGTLAGFTSTPIEELP